MEGYSVTEAASVLGVPTERVWELLARGVLAGTPEGDTGMRVFLQPRPAPQPSPMEMPPPRPVDREPERELSPFRELLTEFRNLTERYGQALLALGEARGEVAALRSRVDLLEARMDLRLPVASPAPAWERPAPVASPRDPTPEPAPRPANDAAEPTAIAEPMPESELGVDDASPDAHDRHSRRRRAGHRWSTEDFAEALARAEDPTAPVLPGADEIPVASITVDTAPVEVVEEAQATELEEADAALPRELPAAEPMPSLEEPQPFAAEVEATPATAAFESEVLPEPEPIPTDAEPEPEAEPDSTSAPPDAGQVDADAEPEPEQAGAEAEPEPVAAVAEPDSDVEARPLEWDPQRYTTEIGEPDWYVEDEPARRPSEPAPSSAEPAPSAAEGTSSEHDGSEREAALGRRMPDRGRPGDDLDARAAARFEEALAALDALSRSSPNASQGSDAPGDSASMTTSAPGDASARSSQAVSRPVHPGPTPGSRAYRRLRRIFPG